MNISRETTQVETDQEQAWAKEREPVVAVLTESYRKAGRPKQFVEEFSKRLNEALRSAQVDGKSFCSTSMTEMHPQKMPSLLN